MFGHSAYRRMSERTEKVSRTRSRDRSRPVYVNHACDAHINMSRARTAMRVSSMSRVLCSLAVGAVASRVRSPIAAAMFWGMKLEPGRWTPFVPPPDVAMRLHVSQATARGDALKDGERVVIKMRCESDEAVLAGIDPETETMSDDEDGFEKEEYRVATLIGGRVETQGLDLVLDEYAEFTVEGSCGVDLTGYYMPEFGDEDVDDEDGMYGEEYDSEEEDEEFAADDVDALESESDDDDDEEEDDDDSDDDDDDSEDEEDDSEDDGDSESDDHEEEEEEAPKVTRKGGVEIREVQDNKKVGDKRPAEKTAAKAPEPKKQAKVEAPPAKKPDVPKRVHKNGMEIINTFATKNTGAKVAQGGKKVAMKYIGKLPSGKIFDQTKGGANFTFRLGVGEVIKGWDVGVEGMREGDKRTLIIPAAMGYGKKGIKGVIPGGSALHFDVELVKVF
jgi:FK506-binding nuclear protein